jgi:phosphoglucosamine mutase
VSSANGTNGRQLFGTDGIRGVAGVYPLDRRTVFAVGRALGARLRRRYNEARVLIGQDTRESSAWMAEALRCGLAAAGAESVNAGVITTPGVAYLTRSRKLSAGVVISASHNPWTDNGIKLFGRDGMKLADAIEHEIEQEIFTHLEELAADFHPSQGEDGSGREAAPGLPPQQAKGRLAEDPGLCESYVEWLAASVEAAKVRGFRVLVDCANGAAADIAPGLFRRCGLEAVFLHTSPDGRNINAGCGALHPEHVASELRRRKQEFDLGITFDGDGDRALFCDERGYIVNGDGVMLIAARAMKQRGTLAQDTVVATSMSNMGLEKCLREAAILLVRVQVGDRYVLEEMLKTGATLGGEQSGHILFMDGEATTGDGLLTALRLLEVLGGAGRRLSELLADFKVFPQVIRNINVREKMPLDSLPQVEAAIKTAEEELDGNGRVVVRYSGTEKVARVMIEAETEELVNKHINAIAEAIQKAIGV